MSAVDGTPDSTLHRAASGYRTTLVAQGVRVAAKILGVVVLARLVSPAEHGRFAMAASLTLLFTLFRDFGAGAAAIQARALTAGQETALCWLHIGLGVILTGLTLAGAPAVAAFYGEPRVTPLLALMSASFALNGLNAWPRTLLGRELRFTELNRLETLGAAGGTAAMILAGALTRSAAAFAWFLLVSEGIMLIEAWRVCRWRPRAAADWPALRALSRTGLHLTGYNLLLYGLQQADTLLMGRWFGAAPLGLYNRAGQLLAQPTAHLATPFSQVLLPTLSRLGPESPDFARHFRQTTNAIAHCTLPVAVLGGILPDEIVRVALGSAWPEAAPLLRCLSVSAGAAYLSATLYPLAVAAGCTGALTQVTAATLPLVLFALWLGSAHGPVGLAAGLAASNALLLAPRLGWVARGTPVGGRDFLAAFAGPLGLAAAFGAGLWIGRTGAASAPPAGRLVSGLLGGTLAVAACLLAWPRARAELREILRHLPFGRVWPQTGETP